MITLMGYAMVVAGAYCLLVAIEAIYLTAIERLIIHKSAKFQGKSV